MVQAGLLGADGMSEHLHIEDHGHVRVLTLDRPEARNALHPPLRRELCASLGEADADGSVHAVVLTAVDPAFSAGVDFKVLEPPAGHWRHLDLNPGAALRAMRTPVICAVNGACVSGALEIALSASFIVASERASFADTHARLGVLPTWGLTALLPRAIGVRRAREMSMTGRFVNAAGALDAGLVNHVVPHEQLLPFSLDLAGQAAGTDAAGQILALYAEGQDLSLAAALALEARRSLGRHFDPAAFAQAGRAAAMRQRGGNTSG
jgi:enoyl-CoA hydratase